MASSLAAQLSVLASKNTLLDPTTGKQYRAPKFKKKVSRFASFLFEQHDAADTSAQTIHGIAMNGFQELLNTDTRFKPFEKTLFGISRSMHGSFDRQMCTEDVLKRLNKSIRDFFQLLSPYFLLGSSHKCIEHLIRRYEAHTHNAEEILAAILPFHETTTFTRMLQLLRFDDSKWDFLAKRVRKRDREALPLLRESLVQQCLSNLSILEFVCEMAKNCEGLGKRGTHKTTFTFYQAVVIDVLFATAAVSEAVMRVIFPYVLKGITSPNTDYKYANYLILCQISDRGKLPEKSFDRICYKIFHDISTSEKDELKNPLICVAYLFETQDCTVVPQENLNIAVKISSLIEALPVIMKDHTITPFLSALFLSLAASLKNAEDMKGRDFLLSAIEGLSLTDTIISEMVSGLLSDYISVSAHLETNVENVSDDSLAKLRREILVEILRQCNLKYSNQMDAIVDTKLKSVQEDSEAHERLVELVTSTFQGTRLQALQDVGTTLFLSLQHPLAKVRIAGLEKVEELHGKGELKTEEMRDLIEPRLNDQDPKVLITLLKMKTSVPKLSPTILFDKLLANLTSLASNSQLGQKPKLKFETARSTHLSEKDERDLTLSILKVLCPRLEECPEYIGHCIPYLLENLTYRVKGSKFRARILKLAQLVDHPLLKGLSDLSKSATKELLQDKTNKILATMLSKNLSDSFKLLLVCLGWIGEGKAKVILTLSVGEFISALQPSQDEECFEIFHQIHKFIDHEWNKQITEPFDAEYFGLLKACLELLIKQLPVGEWTFVDLQLPPQSSSKPVTSLPLVQGIFLTLTTSTTKMEVDQILSLLFSRHLGSVPAQFLMLNFRSEDSNVVEKSLLLFAMFIRTFANSKGNCDFQSCLPQLLLCLNHEKEQVRSAALSCITALRIAIGTEGVVSLYKLEPFFEYHSSQKCSLLPLNILRPLLDEMCHRSQEFLLDQGYCQVFFELFAGRNANPMLGDWTMGNACVCLNIKLKCLLLQCMPNNHSNDFVQQTVIALIKQILESSETPLTRRLFASLLQRITISMCKNQQVFEVLLDILSTERTEMILITLKNVDVPQLFPNLPGDQKCTLYDRLCSLSAHSSPKVVQNVQTILKNIQIHADVLVRYFKPKGSETLRTEMKDNYSGENLELDRLKVVLEVLQFSLEGINELKRLIAPLFSTLSDLNVLIEKASQKQEEFKDGQVEQKDRHDEQKTHGELKDGQDEQKEVQESDDMEMEDDSSPPRYYQRLIMSVLSNILRRYDEKGGVDSSSISVVEIKKCIELTSDKPNDLDQERTQTRNHALRLLTEAVNFVPDDVGFMFLPILEVVVNSEALRRNDGYSISVLQQMVEVVVPVLSKKRNDEFSASILSLLVSAFRQIPSDCRLRLFVIFLTSLGVEHNLQIILGILTSRSLEYEKTQTAMEYFRHSLCDAFPVQTQFVAFTGLIQRVEALLDEGVSKDLRSEWYPSLVQFLGDHLYSDDFSDKYYVTHTSKSSESVQESGQTFLRVLFEFIYLNEPKKLKQSDDTKQRKKNLKLLGHSEATRNNLKQTMNGLAELLQTEGFLKVTTQLLENEDDYIRGKALQALSQKALEVADKHRNDEYGISEEGKFFISSVGQLLELCSQDDEFVENKQAIIIAFGVFAKSFGFMRPMQKSLLRCIDLMIQYIGSENQSLASSSAFTIASICEKTGVGFIQYLPVLMKKIVGAFESLMNKNTEQYSESEVETALSSLLSLLRVISLTLPKFIHSYLHLLLRYLLHPKLLSSSQESGIPSLVSDIFNNLAERTEVRNLLKPVFESYPMCLKYGDKSVCQYFQLIGKICSNLQKPGVDEHHIKIFKFFIEAFNLRRTVSQTSVQNIEQVEGEAVSAFLQLILKLNEEKLTLLFLKLMELAGDSVYQENQDLSNSIVLFRIVFTLSEALQGIFVPYFSHILDFCILHLAPKESNSSSNSSSQPPKKKRRKKRKLMVASQDYLTLTTYIVKSLHQCFLYDDEETQFMSKDRFDKLMNPLLKLFKSQFLIRSEDDYKDFTQNCLIPCLTKLAVAAGEETLWDPLNKATLAITQHDQPLVRYASLSLIDGFYAELGEKFLCFLPKTMSYFSELLEDSDEDVETLCRSVMKRVGTISGEDLMEYMK